MNILHFNVALATAWLMIIAGVALWVSLAVALVVGGAVLLVVTIFLALRAGVVAKRTDNEGG